MASANFPIGQREKQGGDRFFHKTEERVQGCFDQLSAGGWRALEELRDGGEIQGIGAGIDQTGLIQRFLDLFSLNPFSACFTIVTG